MLDLKGSDAAVARLVCSALARHRRSSRVLVSAREWPLLDEIDAGLAQRIASAARPRQLGSLIAHAARRPLDGASLHLRLLASGRLRELQAHVPLVDDLAGESPRGGCGAPCNAVSRVSSSTTSRCSPGCAASAWLRRAGGWRAARRARPACGT